MPSEAVAWIPKVKLAPPRAPLVQIGRAELVGPIESWPEVKLILIHGPAGYGKTVLLSQMHAALGNWNGIRAWISLSEDERNTEALLTLIARALQVALTKSVTALDRVAEMSSGQGDRVILDRIIRDLDLQDGDVWIFMDDLHFADSPSSRAALRRLIRMTRPNIRFVLASRSMIDLGVSHLRVDRRLREVASNDLRFSRAQIESLLADSLTDVEIDQVLADTEGWPVAVRLLKSCLEAGRITYSALLAQGRPRREMFEYLSEQVLAGVSAHVEEFLLVTSLCERVCVDLANVLLGRSDCAATLDTVLRLHLPIDRCADRNGWYQYHSLFAEFLRAAALQRIAARFKRTHALAAQWFAEREHWSEALHHGFHAGAIEEVLEKLERAGGSRIAMRYGHRILRPLANLESHVTRNFPLCRLGQIYYWTLEGQIAAARAALEDLKRRILVDEAQAEDLPATIDVPVLDMLVSAYEERALSIEAIQQLEKRLERLPPAEAPLAAAGHGLVVVAYFDTFQFDACRAASVATLQAYRDLQSPYSETFIHVYAVLVELEQGRLSDARRAVERLGVHVRERLGSQESLRHLPDLLGAVLAYESADFDSGIEQLERARSGFGAVQGWFDLQIQLLRAATLILLRTRGLESGLALIEEADARTSAMGQRNAGVACALHRANLLLRAGEWPAARAVIGSERIVALISSPLDRTERTAYIRAYAGELRAEIDLIEARPQRARESLGGLVDFARQTSWSSALCRLCLLQAAALEQDGAPEAAATHAAEGLDVARRAGLRSCIADRAELISPAIERLLANKQLTLDPASLEYWRSIVGGPESPADNESARQRLRMRLSPRQTQVLELLARGLSSKEIANRLGLGVGTVKAHRISLYRKLGVTLRSEAVAAFERIQKR